MLEEEYFNELMASPVQNKLLPKGKQMMAVSLSPTQVRMHNIPKYFDTRSPKTGIF